LKQLSSSEPSREQRKNFSRGALFQTCGFDSVPKLCWKCLIVALRHLWTTSPAHHADSTSLPDPPALLRDTIMDYYGSGFGASHLREQTLHQTSGEITRSVVRYVQFKLRGEHGDPMGIPRICCRTTSPRTSSPHAWSAAAVSGCYARAQCSLSVQCASTNESVHNHCQKLPHTLNTEMRYKAAFSTIEAVPDEAEGAQGGGKVHGATACGMVGALESRL